MNKNFTTKYTKHTKEENIFTRAKEHEGKNIFTRAEEKEALTYRTVAIGSRAEGGPASLDEKTRSIEVVGATENPVEVWDWERFEVVREVCLMSGCVLPTNRQTVLLDSHQRYGTGSVVGSYRDMHIDSVGATGGSPALVGRAHFTSLPEGDAPYIKVKEGHVTDFSVGYRVTESQWIKAGETSVIEGRKFEGPLRVTTKWVPREMSVCPLGADEMAKVRDEVGGDDDFAKSKIMSRSPLQKFQKENKILQQSKEEQTMKKELRELLIKRGMNADATDDEAWAFLDKHLASERVAVATEERIDSGLRRNDGTSPNVETITRESIRVERERVGEIEAMCKRFEIADEERAKMVSGGTEIDTARKTVMDLVEKHQKENPQRLPTYPMFEGVADEGEKFRAAASDSLVLRGGGAIATPAPGAPELRGYTLREMARLCLQRSGERVPFDPMQMIGRAMVTGDFPIILSNAANKFLFAGWEGAEESFLLWVDDTGSAADFKTQMLVKPGEADDLDLIKEHGEYKYAKMAEAQEQYAIFVYGKIFAISRQSIINDDLDVFSTIPRNHGEACRRKIGDLDYLILTGNPIMGDGKVLFIAAHANIGTAGAVSEVTAGEGVLLMGIQKDIGGKRRLNIPAKYIIGPKTIEGSSRIFFGSTHFSKTNEAATRNNIYADPYFTQVYEGRLDDSSVTQYYFAGPKGKTIKNFYLNGIKTPFLETKQGWTVDGVEMKVRIDVGAKAVDWKGLVRNAGQ